ncbi:MAG: phage tail protein [Anaerolineae bacterium]|nr:phage tail protein [Anaerolineae bacterium]
MNDPGEKNLSKNSPLRTEQSRLGGIGTILTVILTLVTIGQFLSLWTNYPFQSVNVARAHGMMTDSMNNFTYNLDCGTKLTGNFAEASGMGSKHQVVDQPTTNTNGQDILQKVPGGLIWTNITLKRGIIVGDLSLWEWRQAALEGSIDNPPLNCTLTMFDQNVAPVASWYLENIWPAQIIVPEVEETSSGFPVEEIVLVQDRTERVEVAGTPNNSNVLWLPFVISAILFFTAWFPNIRKENKMPFQNILFFKSETGTRLRTLILAILFAVAIAGQFFFLWEGSPFRLAHTVSAQTQDPLPNFRYLLEVEGQTLAYFTEASGLGSENEIVEQKVVDENGREIIRKSPGRLKWTDVTLKRPITDNLDLWEWRERIVRGEISAARRNISITMNDLSGSPIARWYLDNAWPAKIIVSPAEQQGYKMEEITITYESLSREQ